ncbi:MAG TPA: protein-disulfide reductase DsbD family protein [Hyphomicrobium sp.]|nr:protein-disulfide reductase DsbD family protein [Hyphomicrobium sp.]
MMKRSWLSPAGLTAICAVGAALAMSTGALAAQSDWVRGFENKVRLIGISPPRAGSKAAYAAGVEIDMSPGFKTYWRNPGEAGGVPPEFDWAGSDNLASAQVLYPAPDRLIDKAGANIGYKGHVIFPVEVMPKDPGKPVTLHLKAVFGVCKNICIPAEAELEIKLSDKTENSPDLGAAIASVPQTLPVGANPNDSGRPALASWRIEKRDGNAILMLDVAGAGEKGDVFLFSDDGIYLPMTKKVEPRKSATSNAAARQADAIFEGDLSEGGDLKDLAGKSVWVTISGTKGQSESLIALPEDLARL